MRVLQREENVWVHHEIESEHELRELAFGPELVWIRSTGSTPEEFAHLGELFELHPLALEDVQNARQRPKVEDYPGVTFVVVRVPQREGHDVEWLQVGIFVGKDFVLTASTNRNPILDSAEKRLLAGLTSRTVDSADSLFHLIVDTLVDAYFPYLHALQDELEDLEDEVLERAGKQELARIRDLKHEISQTRRIVLPMREAMLSVERAEHPNIAAETRPYLRDVADHMIRINEQVEHVKEVALIAQETWNSTLANSQNESMRRLTVVAALLLVPGLLAGLGGMNFEQGFPAWSFPIVAGTIVGLIILGFAVAWWIDWI
jgi:magnesium transporter